METLKRVSPEEAKSLREVSIYDDKVCQKATHFTLTPSLKTIPASLYETPWEEVTYYTDKEDSDLHPLMQLLKQWNTPITKDN